MFKYGWYKAGYLSDHPNVYMTPVEYCFNPAVLENCEVEDCDSVAYIRCSWCTKQLCFEDFYINYQLCSDFREQRTSNHAIWNSWLRPHFQIPKVPVLIWNSTIRTFPIDKCLTYLIVRSFNQLWRRTAIIRHFIPHNWAIYIRELERKRDFCFLCRIHSVQNLLMRVIGNTVGVIVMNLCDGKRF